MSRCVRAYNEQRQSMKEEEFRRKARSRAAVVIWQGRFERLSAERVTAPQFMQDCEFGKTGQNSGLKKELVQSVNG
jgi:hypothetical protein